MTDGQPEFSDLAAWVREHGGYVDPRMGMAVSDGLRGAVVMEDVEKGELLLECPWQLIIGSSSINHRDAPCEIINALAMELKLADRSLWHKYLRLYDKPDQRIPALWDQETRNQLQGLPPYDATRHTEWVSASCGKPYAELDALTRQAFVAYITRSSDRGMVPIYDLMNHHNGELNTVIKAAEAGLQVVASKSIIACRQVYNSYGVEPTPNIFRDYGFVEQWPQTWSWTDTWNQTHTFMLFPPNVVAIEPDPEFSGDLGRKYVPLESYRMRAGEHTGRLPASTLRRFRAAANTLLDELPTSAGEDAQILQALDEEAGEIQGNDEVAECKMKDLISCMQYRMQFKRAVQVAVAATSTS